LAYNRVIRGEILNSERILDLSSDTGRWIYLALVLEADDFGNIQGGDRRLFRWAAMFSQIKTEADMVRLMSEYQDADLVRGYTGPDGKPYWHLPRTDNQRRWTGRKWPASPWDDPNRLTTIEKRRGAQLPQMARRLAADLPQIPVDSQSNQGPEDENCGSPAATLPQDYGNPSATLPRGVGVGVGVGVNTVPLLQPDHGRDKPARGTRIGKDWVIPDEWIEWAMAYCREQGRHPMPSQVAEWSLEFADYWRAMPGSKGVRLDWAGVWRNAVRNLYAKQAPTQPARSTLRGI
jgi:hypothetical protein